MLTDRFFFFSTGTRQAVTLGACDHTPFFRQVGIIGSFFGRRIIFLAHQFPAGLFPIRLGKIIRVALVDQGNFPRAFFHLF